MIQWKKAGGTAGGEVGYVFGLPQYRESFGLPLYRLEFDRGFNGVRGRWELTFFPLDTRKRCVILMDCLYREKQSLKDFAAKHFAEHVAPVLVRQLDAVIVHKPTILKIA